MHFDLMNLLISVLSWLLAAAGFLLSVTTSILTALIPRLQPKVPEEARYRIRVPPRASREFSEHQESVRAGSGRSNSGSADSLPSFDTAHTHSDRASTTPTRRTTSTPPSSLPNSPEYRLHSLPHSDSTLTKSDSGSKTSVIGHPAHVCTQKCSNHASTSAAASSSFSAVAEEQEAARYRDKADMNSASTSNADSRKKRAKRMVSWLKTTSPSSAVGSQSQSRRTPRSFEDSSRSAPAHHQETIVAESGRRSATFTDDVLLHGSGKPGRRELRRASTLLPFMRFGKSSNRHDVDASALYIPMMSPTTHMSTVPESLSEGGDVVGHEGRKSEPSSPSPNLISHVLPDVDLERGIKERKRKSSYFGRLKRRSSGKEASSSPLILEDRSLDGSSPTQTQFLQPNPVSDRRDTTTTSSTPSSPPHSPHPPAPKKKRSMCERHCRRCRERVRPISAPESAPAVASGPRRTNPYDAPYYFPTPVSPDAVDYVQRARTEIRRGSVSPSANGRRRRLEKEKEGERERREDSSSPSSSPNASGELLKPPSPTSPSPIVRHAKSSGARPSTSTGTGSPNATLLQSAPAQQGSIVLSSPGGSRHRKAASASGARGITTATATAIRVDEFGFVHPVTVSLREKGNRV